MKRVAVIGGGFGGMTAAAELQRLGHRVTLFEAAPALGGKAQSVAHQGVVLDTGPTLLTLPHVVRGAFERLGAADLMPELYELHHHADYHYADGSRFQCFADLGETARSAAAIDAREGRAVERFYAEAAAIHRAAGEPYLEAPYENMLEFLSRVARRGLGGLLKGMQLSTLASMAAKHFHTAHLRSFVGRFATYAGASPYRASSAFALIPHLERAYGVHHVRGGMAALVTALGKAVRRTGVEVCLSQPATWRRHREAYLVGPNGGEREFDALVVNADPLALVGRGDEPLALSGYVLLLKVNRRLSLPHHSAAFAQDYRREFDELFQGHVPYEPTIYVCHPAATDPTVAPPDSSGLFVMVNAPPLSGHASVEQWPQHAARLRELCLNRLKQLCPELQGAEVTVLAERTPVDLMNGGAPQGSIYGFLPHGRLGPFRRPHMQGRAPGLFFAGGGTHPGGGVPLVMLSGHFAAHLASQHLSATA